ncbi:MAG: hypothetical protein AABX37_04955 [Nanoarchaeota archaeon]
MPHCPKCRSSDVKVISEGELSFSHCNRCHYDELAEEIVEESHRNSQREKEKFSPYKAGGSARTKKV